MSTNWLPNLVEGVSIWKLAADLNEPHLFGGRLLVPEVEGSESLPSHVRWLVSGMVPLREARTQDPSGVAAAEKDFQECLTRVSKAFAEPSSPYHRYRTALTVPAPETEGEDNYYLDPTSKQLRCVNWGASPRTMAGSHEFVLGDGAWDRLFGGAPKPGFAAPVAAAAAAVARTTATPEAPKPAETEKKKRRLWPWILTAILAVALAALLIWLLRACDDPNKGGPDAGANVADAGVDASDAGQDASTDATSDASDASTDGAADGDAGSDADDDDDDLGFGDMTEWDDDSQDLNHSDSNGGANGGTGTSGGTVTGSNGGTVTGSNGGTSTGNGRVEVPPGSDGSRNGPHRRHMHPQAVAWKVSQGNAKVSVTETNDGQFDVWLKNGSSFEGVRVEWQDKAGKWHTH
jgi:hypothetical protein